MLDTRLQERFTRGCTDAAFGYTAATTAACAAFTEQVFSFWAGVFEPPRQEPAKTPQVWGWPAPKRPEVPAFAFNPFAWATQQPFAWATPPSPFQAFSFQASPFFAANYAPFQAWLGMFPFATPPAAWPMAFMLMASGVPRSVAWPAAEANAAAMDAADAAAVTVQRVFSSYRTDSGHSSVARQAWPSASVVMALAMLPLSVPLMLGTLRIA